MEKTRWNVQANVLHQGFETKFIETEKMVNVYLMNQSFCAIDYINKRNHDKTMIGMHNILNGDQQIRWSWHLGPRATCQKLSGQMSIHQISDLPSVTEQGND